MESIATQRLDLWRRIASDHELKAGYALAASISIDTEDLEQSILAAWTAELPDRARAGISSLLERPFVQRMSSGFRIEPTMATSILEVFESEDSEHFSRVFEVLLERERGASIANIDSDTEWFASARVAYYLAPLNPSEAAEEFVSSFEKAPTWSANTSRKWLTGLALAQKRYLSHEARTLRFFEAFKDYQEGRPHAASDGFRAVLQQGTTEDGITAVAMHLWAILNPRHHESRQRLQDAITLSDKLGLVENSIMARNSLAAALFRQASTGSTERRIQAIQKAVSLSSDNLKTALISGDSFLVRFTDVTNAVAQILMLQTQGIPIGAGEGAEAMTKRAQADSLVQRLRIGASAYAAVDDIDGYIYTVNRTAGLLRDMGEPVNAIAEIEEVLHRYGDTMPPRSVLGLAKTAGSLRKMVHTKESRDRIEGALARLNEWLASAPTY